MQDEKLFPILPKWAKKAYINKEKYAAMYAESLKHPDAFWAEEAKGFLWHKPWQKVKNTNFKSPVSIKWFEGAKLNLSENCIDRHLPARANQTAIIWEGDDPNESKKITYGELHEQVCKLANALKANGVKKGDRVTIYLPMIPEAAYAMLACARIGAVHSVVFGGFSADAVKGRIQDCGSEIVITADEGLRGGKKVPLKANVDEAIKDLDIRRVLVVKRTGGNVAWKEGRDVWYHDAVAKADSDCKPESQDAEDPLFILYTSGSTGKPKGVLHSTAGYMVWVGQTFKYTFDYHDGEVFWCSADVGWVTGHSYVVYAPLLNGATTLVYEGVPNHPDWGRFGKVIDKHNVTIFHTAPTAIRALMREGDAAYKDSKRTSLKLLGSVGEPINPEAWLWYHEKIGNGKCPIVDTWWQTETGGHMLTPLPGATDLKPGSATLPFFGVQPVILDAQNNICTNACEGLLCIADSWPGQARTIYGDHERFEQTYFSQAPGYYFTGDGAKRDEHEYYWITGRVDDVLNVSGHRLGTAEIESALVGNHHVAEAAVVGFPHDLKGQGIYAYVILKADIQPSDELKKELVQWVRTQISPIATPDHIHFTDALPKTRSGKIMRRILRKIAEGDVGSLGDTSTLTNPEIVDILIKGQKS